MSKKGEKNTGNNNSGNYNSGNYNSGDRNSGNRNSGNRNSGDRNSGYRNSGYRNGGDLNSGNRNSGNYNSGDRNSGNRNSGYLNSDSPKVRIFGVQTDIEFGDISFPDWFCFDTLLWVSEGKMSEKEKEDNPLYGITGGYLKKLSDASDSHAFMKDCWRLAFHKCKDLEDIRKTLELPHFTYEKFENISGISEEDFEKKLGTKIEIEKSKNTIVIDGVTYKRVD